jgi:UDP-3-O-[3-hydroxymyristoyl] glucosamine N-acyltransferase
MIDNRFFKSLGPFSLGRLCDLIHIPAPEGVEATVLFETTASLTDGGVSSVSFFHNPKYLNDLKQTKAGACVVAKEFLEHVPPHTVALVSERPYRDFAKICSAFYPRNNTYVGVNPSAFIAPTAVLGAGCAIAPGVVIEDGVVLGKNCFVGPNTVIEQGCSIGNNAVIESNVTISHAIIGDDVFIKPGARIGQPGFGFYMDEQGHFDVPQLGRVLIGNHVHIGANTTIDRGSQADTLIGNGVRIDNLVQIAHNVEVGDNSVLVAQVGVAGSTKLGRFVIAAGQVGIAGHLTVEDGVKIAAQSGLMRNVGKGETVAGSPAVPVRDWHRQTIALQKLAKEKGK